MNQMGPTVEQIEAIKRAGRSGQLKRSLVSPEILDKFCKTAGKGLDYENEMALKGWRVERAEADGMHVTRWDKLSVIVTFATESDNRPWAHLSVARQNTTPSQVEFRDIIRLFFGDKREAVMVFPPKQRYMNFHPHCLHAFTRMDALETGLPHFEGVANGVVSL